MQTDSNSNWAREARTPTRAPTGVCNAYHVESNQATGSAGSGDIFVSKNVEYARALYIRESKINAAWQPWRTS